MSTARILIVENEAIVAEDLAGKVRQLGHEVAAITATGEEAVELARRLRPDLVLMDIRLAGAMDGIAAAGLIHRECNLPVVFLTAHSDAGTVERAQQAAAFGYILKPFDDRDLRIQIEMALYKHAAERQLRERDELLAAINRVLLAALTCETEHELGATCLAAAEQISQSAVGVIGDLGKAGFATIAGGGPDWPAAALAERLLRDGRGFFRNDPAREPGTIAGGGDSSPPWPLLVVPLRREGNIIGLLAVGNRRGGYSQAEQDALEALTPSIVEAFLRLRAKEELRLLNEELEKRVEKRTIELQETQKQYLHAEKLSAIGKFSASIAHEFNNPLQCICTILRGLQQTAALADEERAMLGAAISEGDRIKTLLRSLQDFNRPSSGKKEAIDLHSSLDAVLLLLKSDLKKKRIAVTKNYAANLPPVPAVRDQIKQVLLNLLANAAEACPESGGEITVTTWREDDQVAVAIRDTGIGIQPDQMNQIFRPFFTTKAEVKGTGLGLSISYGIIKKHRGEIRVESRPGEGAIFVFLLPIC